MRRTGGEAGAPMIDLREMKMLAALARHGHFAHAAKECGISQPAFSMRIRGLEEKLGVSIVRRGNRFEGFTEEGEMVLTRARRLLAEARALEQDMLSARGVVTGRVSMAVVPTALAFASRVAAELKRLHPGATLRIVSASSLQILQGLEEGAFDVGLTYRDGVSEDLFYIAPLYEEGYVLAAPATLAPHATGPTTWTEAAALPLILLDRQMQNRRILERTFAGLGLNPVVAAETNAISAALLMAQAGIGATILPAVLASAFATRDDFVISPLIEPALSKSICLATLGRRRDTPVVGALRRTAEAVAGDPDPSSDSLIASVVLPI